MSTDPNIAALGQKIRSTLTFFGSGLRYEHDDKKAYGGMVYFRENGEERLVYLLNLGYDGNELCVIGLSPENGYRNDTLQRALFSASVSEQNVFRDI